MTQMKKKMNESRKNRNSKRGNFKNILTLINYR